MAETLDVNAVYDVLVEECGAVDTSEKRAEFAYHWPDCVEFRFIGELGFGGKVWAPGPTYGEQIAVRVTCYTEDSTPKRQWMIERANARFREMLHG